MMLHSNNMVAKNAKISILIQTLFQPQNIDSISNKAAGPTLNKKYLSSPVSSLCQSFPKGHYDKLTCCTLRLSNLIYLASN